MNYQPAAPPPFRPSEDGRERIRPAGQPRRSNFGLGCGMFALGFVAAIAALVVGAILWLALTSRPVVTLTRPPVQAGVPDISATLSETYLNKEIARQLNGKPYKAGPVDIIDMVVRVKEGAQVEVDVKASSGPVKADLRITQLVTIVGGKARLDIVGEPRLMGGTLPPAVNVLLDTINTQFIEPQLNQQLTKIVVNQRPIRLVGVTSTPGLLSVQANVE